MPDYEPLDLISFCNAGTSFFPRIDERESPPIGPRTFRGLPFLIGGEKPDRSRCYIGLSGDAGTREEVRIPLVRTARRVLFAHALLESRLHEGETVGTVVARYRFRFEDGEEIVVPIRERFEIAEVPTGWGELPFIATPDENEGLLPRYEGAWGMIGHRQQEVIQAFPDAYYLWSWENPHPDRVLDSVILEPAGRKAIVAAITLGHIDEPPFVRTGKREVRIVLSRQEDAEKPFGLEVEVDRGVATFPYALPEATPEAFVADELKGWGEPQNRKSSPSYVEIAAIPSATVTVKHRSEELGRANWGELETKGKIETDRVRLEVVDRGRNWVHVTILDDETGRPVPCRVHFRSQEGIPYQPHGHHNQVNRNLGTWHSDIGGDLRLGQITYAYIDGKCQGWMPRGEVLVDVARGFEYEPLRSRVEIRPGQRELTLRLKRWTDMNGQGWYSGDTHVHFLGSQGAQREAQGEDLNVVNLLASQWGHLFTNTEDFTGKPTVSEEGKTIVYCSQENRQHLIGHLSLLGLKEPVYPWCTDGPSEAEMGGTLEEVMSHWADACHAQGGTVVIPHLPNPNGEPAVLIATGRADAVEMLVYGQFNHVEYYRYLNGGYRLPLVGGTDKMTSDVPVGIYRTYARLDPERPFTYDSWCDAVKAGRTFLSGGPMIGLRVEGHEIGDTVSLPKGGGTVEVEAWSRGIFPMKSLEIVRNGQVVAVTEEAGGARELKLRTTLSIEGDSWVAARCGGPNYQTLHHLDGWGRGVFAHTSPVYVAVGGEYGLFSPETAQYMLTLIEGGLTYIRHHSRQYPEERVTHHHEHEDHLDYLEGPFKEAAAAIHRRMHELGMPH